MYLKRTNIIVCVPYKRIVNKPCKIKTKKDIIQNMCTRKNVLYIAYHFNMSLQNGQKCRIFGASFIRTYRLFVQLLQYFTLE